MTNRREALKAALAAAAALLLPKTGEAERPLSRNSAHAAPYGRTIFEPFATENDLPPAEQGILTRLHREYPQFRFAVSKDIRFDPNDFVPCRVVYVAAKMDSPLRWWKQDTSEVRWRPAVWNDQTTLDGVLANYEDFCALRASLERGPVRNFTFWREYGTP